MSWEEGWVFPQSLKPHELPVFTVMVSFPACLWRCSEVLLGISFSPASWEQEFGTPQYMTLSPRWGDQLAIYSIDIRYQGLQVDQGSSGGPVPLWRKYPSSLSRHTSYICRGDREFLMSWTLIFLVAGCVFFFRGGVAFRGQLQKHCDLCHFHSEVCLKLNEPNWTSKHKSNPSVFSTSLPLKMLLLSGKHATLQPFVCWVILSSGYLWVRFSAGRGWQLALEHGQSSSRTGLCIINTLSHSQWCPLQKGTEPKFLMSTWLLRVLPRLLTRNSQWTRNMSASEARLSLIQSCIFQTAYQ